MTGGDKTGAVSLIDVITESSLEQEPSGKKKSFMIPHLFSFSRKKNERRVGRSFYYRARVADDISFFFSFSAGQLLCTSRAHHFLVDDGGTVYTSWSAAAFCVIEAHPRATRSPMPRPLDK